MRTLFDRAPVRVEVQLPRRLRGLVVGLAIGLLGEIAAGRPGRRVGLLLMAIGAAVLIADQAWMGRW